jgi:hypothetical protein
MKRRTSVFSTTFVGFLERTNLLPGQSLSDELPQLVHHEEMVIVRASKLQAKRKE